jgi:putative DNA primase/helicase
MNQTTFQKKINTQPSYAATDPHRLADAYLAKHGQDLHRHPALRFWRDEFWQFHEGRYRTVSHSELQARITGFVRQEFERTKPVTRHKQIVQVTRNIVGNVIQALAGSVHVADYTEQPVWLSGREREAGPFFVFTNGMVAAKALIADEKPPLRQHCSHWFTQTAFPYAYEENARCERWTAFLDEVLNKDTERIALIQEWFGYCLTNDTSHQRFIVALGDGQNGKSVLLDILTAVLGPENVSHIPVEVFGQRFQLTMTLGKLANISYDTGKIGESAEATIKQFTGGDRMYFDRKGVPGIHAYPTARVILATNHEPRFEDRSSGIWRRMIVVPFNVSIPKDRQDPQLAAKLKAELPGILNWSVDGLRRLRAHGQFTIPSASQAAWEEFRQDSNPANEFLTSRYSQGEGDPIGCSTIYDEYRDWCRVKQLRALDATSFGKEVRKAFPKVSRGRETTGQREWFYEGIHPISEDDEMDLRKPNLVVRFRNGPSSGVASTMSEPAQTPTQGDGSDDTSGNTR